MRRSFVAIALSVALTGAARADAFEDADARAAYETVRGNCRIAIDLLMPFAEQGIARAQTGVANAYLAIRCNDPTQSLRWMRLAAEQSDPYALGMMSEAYKQGAGVRRDAVQSYMWHILYLERASRVGALETPEQSLARARRELRMTPAQVAEAQRLAREWDAAHPAQR